ncbi:MAG: Rieske (2Fe-2S) protein [Chloroflexota bacterium]|nr:Rieske (2Fe-2S) protein [Chloroflexota bacterium]
MAITTPQPAAQGEKQAAEHGPGDGLLRATTLKALEQQGVVTISGAAAGLRHGVAVFLHEGRVYAMDNRCPHMGFPMSQGSCKDGIVTCNWHYARFDLASGGTFDPWADDVKTYPTTIKDGEVWVDLRAAAESPEQRQASRQHWLGRLDDGMEQNIPLVQAKAVLQLLDLGASPSEIVARAARYPLRFGSRRNSRGWGDGLTILTAMANTLTDVSSEDRSLALYHGLRRAGEDAAGRMERVELDPLPTDGRAGSLTYERLKGWFRQFVEVRHEDAAERTLRTAVASGATPAQLADMLGTAATDHAYRDFSHVMDTIAKQCELLDLIGWSQAPAVLPAVVSQLCTSTREEEGNAWQHPIDLVALVEPAIRRLAAVVDLRVPPTGAWAAALPETLLGDDPRAAVDAVMAALERGAAVADVAQALAYAAALRYTRFPTSNEFGDWDTVLHHFTYCAALAQMAKRAPSAELARGILHGVMVLHLGRFLNLPAARLPGRRILDALPDSAARLTAEYLALCDQQARVDQAGAVVYRYLSLGHVLPPLLQTMSRVTLREDASFHDYQTLEEGFRLVHDLLESEHVEPARQVLVGIARWQAAHAPTRRAVTQTYDIARRLHRGEAVYEGAAPQD